MYKRRDFLKHSGAAVAATALSSIPFVASAFGQRSNQAQTLRVGLIGCRGMGWNNLKSFLKNKDVSVSAICDIDENVIANRMKELGEMGVTAKSYKDYRRLLDDRDVDVVIIATPDHWHCLQLVDACAAGKDVYAEKPLANSITESRVMVQAVEQHNRIVQVNQWQRSQAHFKNAMNYVQGGKLGKIAMVKTWMHRGGSTPLPVVNDDAVPAGVDYKTWLGPAKERPFNKNRFHYEFRWFWDYAGGLMTDWGVHLIDVALWGMKATHPKTIVCSGGKYVFPEDARETPDTQNVLYNYGDFDITWEHTLAGGRGYFNQNHGIAFIGKNGTLVVSRKGWEVIPEKDLIEAVPWQDASDNGLDLHVTNFIEAVRSKDKSKLNCPVTTGALVAEVSHMGNIAYRTGETLHWDSVKNKFAEKGASRMIGSDYHNGYKMPG
jgi:predicted dehydrogenase